MGVRLHGASAGNGPGLVLLHPVGLDHAFWGGLIEQASDSHRVLALDLRGHGGSPTAAAGLGLSDYAADVRESMTASGLDTAVILGLSFGGMIAQRFALTYPDAVSGLVACGCTAGFADELRPVLRERGLAAERGGMAAVAEATIERWFTPAFRSDPAVEGVRRRLASDDVAGWSAAWHAIADHDALADLGAVRAPALIIAGERDAATPIAAAKALAEAVPGAALTVLPGAPHMMQIESAAAFAVAVMTFLASLPRA